MKNITRRELLKGAGAVLASVAAPSILHAANGDGKGIDASRVGLVIGNSKYPDSPLTNPANDAKAIAQVLGVMGFKTQLLLNASLKDMSNAVEAYVEQLSRQKAVGLFYYAGHGIQLGWRNYIIPVGAAIDRLNDVPKQAYELNIMLAALTKAKNPMNIIVLDACRDNPFGKRVLPEQKGLSQFDAPIGSLLSYATSPGNTASDGAGANGLFTENLLREMKVPLSKIEDVFKRVRLNVRLQSNGGQIPWESTSLEDDFYFIPNEAQFKQVELELTKAREKAEADSLATLKAKATADSNSKALIEAEAKARLQAEADSKERAQAETNLKAQLSLQKQTLEQRMAQDLALWEKALATPTATATEDYLKQYPSGSYSELAQARLDALLAKAGEKKLALQSNLNNPYTKGSASGLTRYTVGDQFTYVQKDGLSGVIKKTYTEIVSSVSDTQTVFDGGEKIIDILGNVEKSRNARRLSVAQFYPASYELGKTWNVSFSETVPASWSRQGEYRPERETNVAMDLKIFARELITTSAGTFNAFHVIGYGFRRGGGKVELSYWIDPDKCSAPILQEWIAKNSENMMLFFDKRELTGFQQRALS